MNKTLTAVLLLMLTVGFTPLVVAEETAPAVAVPAVAAEAAAEVMIDEADAMMDEADEMDDMMANEMDNMANEVMDEDDASEGAMDKGSY